MIHELREHCMAETKLELPDLLANLSAQLIAAHDAAQARGNPIMQFEECEIELAVKLEISGKAGVKFWVVELGAGAKAEHSSKIKVKFKPLPGMSLQAPQVSLANPAPAARRQTKKNS
jgi:hypothetical protein